MRRILKSNKKKNTSYSSNVSKQSKNTTNDTDTNLFVDFARRRLLTLNTVDYKYDGLH